MCRGLLKQLAVVILMLCGARGWAQQSEATFKAMADEILRLENVHRKELHLKPMRMNGIITAAATKHTRDMVSKKVSFGHDGFNERMEKLSKQLKPCYSFAENVAYGPETAGEVVDQWLKSDEHRKNMEGKDYNLTGIGILKDTDGRTYFTQIFIYRGN